MQQSREAVIRAGEAHCKLSLPSCVMAYTNDFG